MLCRYGLVHHILYRRDVWQGGKHGSYSHRPSTGSYRPVLVLWRTSIRHTLRQILASHSTSKQKEKISPVLSWATPIMKSSGGITLRLATLHDLDAMTSINVSVVYHDGFHEYFFPGEDEYPEDVFDWWRRSFRRTLLRPYVMTIVAETASKEIVGFASWCFAPRGNQGVKDTPKPKGLDLAKDSYFEILQRHYYAAVDKISSKFSPNRAVDQDRLSEFGAAMAKLNEKRWGGDERIHWMCNELAVVPAYKDACFRTLLQWGFDQAEVDCVSNFAGCPLSKVEEWEKEDLERWAKIKCGPTAEAWILKRVVSKA